MAGEVRGRKSRVAHPKTIFAWQGWWLELPARWNPVKLEGDYEQGHALFADLHRPRLGLRWHRPRKRRMSIRRLLRGGVEFDAEAWSRQAMREEVGMLAAEEAVEWWGEGSGQEQRGSSARGETVEGEIGSGHEGRGDEKWEVSLLYLEPDPPGRDIWLGFSRRSGRAVQVTHHANRREMILANVLLPALEDLPAEGMQPWSVFELSCRVPAEMRLERHVLNAGDLSLIFAGGGRNLLVRQIAVAHLALKRQPLERWLLDQMWIRRRHYRVMGKAEAVEAQREIGDGRSEMGVMKGLSQWMRRRRRFGWMRWIPRGFVTYALHDEARDRLVIVQGTEEGLVREVAATVGWAVA